MAQSERQRIAVNLWTARLIPIVLAAAVAYATYVLVALLCVNYLILQHSKTNAAIAILVTYFFLFFMMAASFFRTLYTTTFDPPYLPFGPSHTEKQTTYKEKGGRANSGGDDISAGAYDTSESAITQPATIAQGTDDPLYIEAQKLFYSKDMFVCGPDGDPKWCPVCANWKPDRTHHCGDAGRCILKMDHFCPWVGGPIGENNFKFFTQFNVYAALYCIEVMVVMAIYIHKQLSGTGSIDPQFAAALGLASFFGMFTAGIAVMSLMSIFKNTTQVESFKRIITLSISKGEGAPRSIITLEEGTNPWDLGSSFLNFKTVMGTNLFDWILPIRRSPCCNHVSAEGHFPFGPAVNQA